MSNVTLESLDAKLTEMSKAQKETSDDVKELDKKFDTLVSTQCPLHSVQIANNTNDLYWLKRFFWVAVTAVVSQFIANMALYKSMQELIAKIK